MADPAKEKEDAAAPEPAASDPPQEYLRHVEPGGYSVETTLEYMVIPHSDPVPRPPPEPFDDPQYDALDEAEEEEIAPELIPPDLTEFRERRGSFGPPIRSFSSNAFPNMGPPLYHSGTKGNPLGPFGFELYVPKEEDKSDQPDHIMSADDLNRALSNVSHSVDGGQIVYSTLVYRNMCLSNIDIFQNFVHLRYIFLPKNRLTSLLALSNMRYLILLEVGHNKIREATEIPCFPFLECVNYTRNVLESLTGYPVTMASYIGFNYNKLRNLNGLTKETFTGLKTLEIRGNHLTHFGPLDLPNLQHLWAAQNRFTSLGELAELKNLETLHCRSNRIHMLHDFPTTLANLKYINLRDNQIDRFTQVRHLGRSPVECLILLQNPITTSPKYRMEVLTCIITLIRLDKERTTEYDLKTANYMRQGRRNKYIPPLRDDVISATPPPTPFTDTDRSDRSDGTVHEMPLNRLNPQMQNLDAPGTPLEVARVSMSRAKTYKPGTGTGLGGALGGDQPPNTLPPVKPRQTFKKAVDPVKEAKVRIKDRETILGVSKDWKPVPPKVVPKKKKNTPKDDRDKARFLAELDKAKKEQKEQNLPKKVDVASQMDGSSKK